MSTAGGGVNVAPRGRYKFGPPVASEGSEGTSSRPTDLPAPPPADPLAALLRSAPPLGAWVEDAACAALDEDAAAVFTTDNPDAADLAYAEAVCWRCPVRQECADYAAQVPSWGLWGADWYTGPSRRACAA